VIKIKDIYLFMRKLLFLIFVLTASNGFGQTSFLVKGLVFEVGNTNRLAQVYVTNKNSKELKLTDEWGNFSIPVNLGDTLIFAKNGYQEQYKSITAKQNLIIYLGKAIILEEVVVKQQTKKAQQQEILDGYRSKGVYYNGKPPLLAYFFTPLTALNELIGKDANNARRFGIYVSNENAAIRVDNHFNEQIIKESIKIKDAELVEFMYLHRPKPEDVIYRNHYDDMAYVRKAYQEYLKNKNQFFK
jgi:hypothetical protein